jgi:hypothetical protein
MVIDGSELKKDEVGAQGMAPASPCSLFASLCFDMSTK